MKTLSIRNFKVARPQIEKSNNNFKASKLTNYSFMSKDTVSFRGNDETYINGPDGIRSKMENHITPYLKANYPAHIEFANVVEQINKKFELINNSETEIFKKKLSLKDDFFNDDTRLLLSENTKINPEYYEKVRKLANLRSEVLALGLTSPYFEVSKISKEARQVLDFYKSKSANSVTLKQIYKTEERINNANDLIDSPHNALIPEFLSTNPKKLINSISDKEIKDNYNLIMSQTSFNL